MKELTVGTPSALSLQEVVTHGLGAGGSSLGSPELGRDLKDALLSRDGGLPQPSLGASTFPPRSWGTELVSVGFGDPVAVMPNPFPHKKVTDTLNQEVVGVSRGALLCPIIQIKVPFHSRRAPDLAK